MHPTPPPGKTDDELATLDITALLRYGIGFGGSHRTALFGDGAVGAAVVLDRQGVLPRAVAFLAEIVRSGGTGYAAALPEPVPGDAAAQLVCGWLQSAASVVRTVEGDQDVARWLESVAALMALRLTYRARTAGPGAG
ncbi:hypothetical protein SAMN05216511_6444 [Streptomyces sp. KS_16]|nr:MULTISPECIES: hypothetical protein [unclassified Streptomyces]PBC80925.1 hypothetical protein BX261_0775 [Streptomyces sp. 2321.6]SDR56911.1 hypothetical protein SAMN05216511_6444 [Streptomyces sp. KS_16]SEB94105.1 hypothetical protein SAMN05428940_0774 [Streptomyces sp. 2133.1]SNC62839.1 hypothetical protein SAMN06272741_0772 [Streptomyces sp. 2114.4]